MEGDTPAFFHIIPNGLSNPEHPDWGGWGGRYALYTPPTEVYFYEPETRPLWTNVVDEVIGIDGENYSSNHATIWRWREGYQYDFAARIDWSNTPKKGDANHQPIAAVFGNTTRDIARLTAKPGETVTLNASASYDPDGDEVSHQWIYYREAGTTPLDRGLIGEGDKPVIEVEIPDYARNGTLHFVLEVTDNGDPTLYSYRRVIVEVTD
jgi:hypothetical protein